MRTLFLLRHGKSAWDEPGLADRDRPLAPRGTRSAAKMGAFMRRKQLKPQLVLCSSATRATQTLAGLDLGEVPTLVEDGLYAAAEPELLARLQQLPDGVERVLVIAHNPGLEELAISLAAKGQRLGGLRAGLPTCALVTLTVLLEWAELRPGTALMAGFQRPKTLA